MTALQGKWGNEEVLQADPNLYALTHLACACVLEDKSEMEIAELALYAYENVQNVEYNFHRIAGQIMELAEALPMPLPVDPLSRKLIGQRGYQRMKNLEVVLRAAKTEPGSRQTLVTPPAGWLGLSGPVLKGRI
jgi:hypothetical protein